MKRKRIYLIIGVLAVGLLFLVLAGCCKTPQATNETHSAYKISSLYRHEYDSAVTDVSSDISDIDITPDDLDLHTTDETSQPIVSPPVTCPPIASPPVNEGGNQPSGSAISLDRAIEIANADLKSRNISATYHSNSGIDLEKGQRVWELLFRTHGERMPLIEYYINADNGNIVKFEWDD